MLTPELREIRALGLHVPTSEASAPRQFANPGFAISLSAGLMCSPHGGGSSVAERVDEAFVSKYLVDMEQLKFRKGGLDALRELMHSHPDMGQHFQTEWPTSQSKKRRRGPAGAAQACNGTASGLSGTPSVPGTPSASGMDDEENEAEEESADLGSSGGGFPAAAATAAPAAAAPPAAAPEPAAEQGPPAAAGAAVGNGKPAELGWPDPTCRHVMKASKYKAGGRLLGRVHAGSEWYACFSCGMDAFGCPARGIILRRRGAAELLVIFKGACSHSPDARPHGQLRGAARRDAVLRAGSSTAAAAHARDSMQRSTEQQLSDDTSRTGGSSQVRGLKGAAAFGTPWAVS